MSRKWMVMLTFEKQKGFLLCIIVNHKCLNKVYLLVINFNC